MAVQLTEDAKRAIQSYLFKLVIPSALGLSILSLIVGFFLDRVARGDAYAKAYGEASGEIIKLASAVGAQKASVDESKKQVDDAQKQVESAKAKVVSALEAVQAKSAPLRARAHGRHKDCWLA
jgi:hypothetical protein